MSILANISLTSVANYFANFLHWIDQNISVVVFVLVALLAASLVSRVMSRVAAKLLHRAMRDDMFPTKTDRERRLHTLNSIAEAIISFFVWALVILMVLNRLGVNTAPLLASAGILGVALGFGAQSLVRDFVTGIFIIAENQYRVGDYVEIQNVKGTVQSISMRTTVIQDDDGSVFHVPNGSIVVTGNHTMNNNKVSIELSASTDTDIEKLRKTIDGVGKTQAESTDLKDVILEPLQFKRIKDIKGSQIIVRVSGRVKAGSQSVVRSSFYEQLQKQLIKQKIALK